MKRTTLAALALLAACAPAAGPDAPAPDPTPAPAAPAMAAALNPVGVYEFTAFQNDEPVAAGTIEITGQPGAYGGRIHVEDEGEEAAITSVTVNRPEMTLNAATPDGTMTITMTFTGDTFQGRWTLNDESGDIRGRRRP
ncbi:MAG TPA: hypothetical protein VGX50_08930 [Longimicrobium sp.]|jgi:hypothetical protein|nr:hypothetical protein [Longimicrobium sp.]